MPEIINIPNESINVTNAKGLMYYYTYNGVYATIGDYAYSFIVFLTLIGVSILKRNIMMGVLFATILNSLFVLFGASGFIPITARYYMYSTVLYVLAVVFIAIHISRRR